MLYTGRARYYYVYTQMKCEPNEPNDEQSVPLNCEHEGDAPTSFLFLGLWVFTIDGCLSTRAIAFVYVKM